MSAVEAGLFLLLAVVVGVVLLMRHLHRVDDRTRADLAHRTCRQAGTQGTHHV